MPAGPPPTMQQLRGQRSVGAMLIGASRACRVAACGACARARSGARGRALRRRRRRARRRSSGRVAHGACLAGYLPRKLPFFRSRAGANSIIRNDARCRRCGAGCRPRSARGRRRRRSARRRTRRLGGIGRSEPLRLRCVSESSIARALYSKRAPIRRSHVLRSPVCTRRRRTEPAASRCSRSRALPEPLRRRRPLACTPRPDREQDDRRGDERRRLESRTRCLTGGAVDAMQVRVMARRAGSPSLSALATRSASGAWLSGRAGTSACSGSASRRARSARAGRATC